MDRKLILPRLLIVTVVIWNLQAALTFLLHPAEQAFLIGLPPEAGAAVVAGMGLLFVMWNVPYVVALRQPLRYRLSLFEAIAMQTIGLIGESLILLRLDPAVSALHQTIVRFIIFDAAGLILLALAAWLSRSLGS